MRKQLDSENVSETLGLNRSHSTHWEEHSKEPLKLSQLGFAEGKSFLIKLIAFYDKITGFVDKARSVDITYVNCSKAFDSVSNNILVSEVRRYGLDGWTTKNWLEGWAQRRVVNGLYSTQSHSGADWLY